MLQIILTDASQYFRKIIAWFLVNNCEVTVRFYKIVGIFTQRRRINKLKLPRLKLCLSST